jgi:hypothetical protein
VWPNQCHFLSLTCSVIGCWLFISHRSSSDITSGHFMLKIHRRHPLIKTCSRLIIGSTTSHFSQPYVRPISRCYWGVRVSFF